MSLQRAERLMTRTHIPLRGHAVLKENLATYLDNLPGKELQGRWGEKIKRDLGDAYTDIQVFDRLHSLEEGLRELATHLPGDAKFWISGGISKGRAAAGSDIDGFVDCGGLSQEQFAIIQNLPGWNSQRLNVYTPDPKATPSPEGDWLIGNYYGGLSKESEKNRDIDLLLVGRTDGQFDPASAGMGGQSACLSRDQVLQSDFLVELFSGRFESKGYRIRGHEVFADGPRKRPPELEWPQEQRFD